MLTDFFNLLVRVIMHRWDGLYNCHNSDDVFGIDGALQLIS